MRSIPSIVSWVAFAALTATGCFSETADGGASGRFNPPPLPGHERAPVELIFRSDGTKAVRGILMPGVRATLRYELNRFERCITSVDGFDGFSARAFVRGDGGPWTEHVLTRIHEGRLVNLEPEIRVPDAFRLEMTFYASNDFGCAEEDPEEGDPYSFPVINERPQATIRFDEAGDPEVVGELREGAAVTVVYPVDRLNDCRGERDGVPTWNVSVQFRTSQVMDEALLTAFESPDLRHETPARVDVPQGADSLEIWFRNWDHTGCEVFEPRVNEGWHFEL